MISLGETQELCDVALTNARQDMTLVFRLPHSIWGGQERAGSFPCCEIALRYVVMIS